jgi:hypothetical protein
MSFISTQEPGQQKHQQKQINKLVTVNSCIYLHNWLKGIYSVNGTPFMQSNACTAPNASVILDYDTHFHLCVVNP